MDTPALTDPRLAALPVEECGEPLIDVCAIQSLTADDRCGAREGSSTRLRATVVDRLVTAQSLLPRGVRLLVIEGHRSMHRQQEHFAECVADLAAVHPDWPIGQVREEAGWHCSPSGTAPHRTGAAVDVSLCDPEGRELDLGGPVYATPLSTVDSTPSAVANRRILRTALGDAGLINLPTAWWHWSFGDPYWALATGAPAVQYGPVDV
jgi:D-alanyl-D-alanine dipeptidase